MHRGNHTQTDTLTLTQSLVSLKLGLKYFMLEVLNEKETHHLFFTELLDSNYL